MQASRDAVSRLFNEPLVVGVLVSVPVLGYLAYGKGAADFRTLLYWGAMCVLVVRSFYAFAVGKDFGVRARVLRGVLFVSPIIYAASVASVPRSAVDWVIGLWWLLIAGEFSARRFSICSVRRCTITVAPMWQVTFRQDPPGASGSYISGWRASG